MSHIKQTLEELRERRSRLQGRIKVIETRMQNIRDICPHTNRKRWTNNDGDGQFVVERCEECGEQKDGGLGDRSQ